MSGSSDYTLTPNYHLYKPNYDADVDNWGYHLNNNADTLDAALATSGGGAVFLPLSGAVPMRGALTLSDGGTAISQTAADGRYLQQAQGDARYLQLTAGGTVAGATTFSSPLTLADGGTAISQTAGDARYVNVAGADTMAGPLTLTGPLIYTATGGTTARAAQDRAADVSLNVADFGGSIQAALNALPATGGTVMLEANKTYVVTAALTSAKPNVKVTAPSWATILRRDPGYNSAGQLTLTGANAIIEGFTIDGNSVTGTQFEVSVAGAGSIIRNMQVINGGGTGHINLQGQNSRATDNTVTGLGTIPSTQRGYGIWAINHVTVMIDNNTITGTGIDGIGFDGSGTCVIGNTVSGCHCWNGGQGGQIASYYTSTGGVGTSPLVIGNYIGAPGSNQGMGIECWMPGMLVSGNTIENIPQAGIILFGNSITVTGNSIRNCGGTADGLVVTANITDFVITGNRISDDQATPTMRYAISIYAGASDRYTIAGNQCLPNTTAAIFDGGTGTNKTIVNNLGASNRLNTATTMSGALTLTGVADQVTVAPGAAGLATMVFSGAATQRKAIRFQTAGVNRWVFQSNATAEGGANAGSDLELQCYADAGGAALYTPITVTRATGNVGFSQGINLGSTTAGSSTDLSKHIAVWGTTIGFNATAGAFNYVGGASTTHSIQVGGNAIFNVGANGAVVVGTGYLAFGSGASGANIRSGAGAATGTQPSGSLWLRTDGSAGARLYVSQGAGTWVPVASV